MTGKALIAEDFRMAFLKLNISPGVAVDAGIGQEIIGFFIMAIRTGDCNFYRLKRMGFEGKASCIVGEILNVETGQKPEWSVVFGVAIPAV